MAASPNLIPIHPPLHITHVTLLAWPPLGLAWVSVTAGGMSDGGPGLSPQPTQTPCPFFSPEFLLLYFPAASKLFMSRSNAFASTLLLTPRNVRSTVTEKILGGKNHDCHTMNNDSVSRILLLHLIPCSQGPLKQHLWKRCCFLSCAVSVT